MINKEVASPIIKEVNDEVLKKTKPLRIVSFVFFMICVALFVATLIVSILLVTDNRVTDAERAEGFATLCISGFFTLIFAILTYKGVRLIKPKDQRQLTDSIATCFALFMASIFFGFGLLMIDSFIFTDNPSNIAQQYGTALVVLDVILFISAIVGIVIASITKKTNNKYVKDQQKKTILTSSLAHNDFDYADTMAENRRLKQELAELENKELKEKIEKMKSKK